MADRQYTRYEVYENVNLPVKITFSLQNNIGEPIRQLERLTVVDLDDVDIDATLAKWAADTAQDFLITITVTKDQLRSFKHQAIKAMLASG